MRSSPGTKRCPPRRYPGHWSRRVHRAGEGAPRGGLVALCITQTTGWGIPYYALPAAVLPISEDTGWDLAFVTGALSAGLLVSAGAGILTGRALDRTGPRALMVAGCRTGVLSLVLVGLAPNLPLFAAAWLLAGTSQGAVLHQRAFTVIRGCGTGRRVRLPTVRRSDRGRR
jgi:MFS family permease